jgi:hypothetical protein
VGAAPGWQARVAAALVNASVLFQMAALSQMDRHLENSVARTINNLCVTLCAIMGKNALSHAEEPVVVGGFLAEHRYDFLSRTDGTVRDSNNRALVTFEVKRSSKFPLNCIWYNTSRGVQTFAAMWGHQCPAFLVSSRAWKLLIPTRSGTGVLTLPFARGPLRTDVASLAVGRMGMDFVRALAICLLGGESAQFNNNMELASSAIAFDAELPRAASSWQRQPPARHQAPPPPTNSSPTGIFQMSLGLSRGPGKVFGLASITPEGGITCRPIRAWPLEAANDLMKRLDADKRARKLAAKTLLVHKPESTTTAGSQETLVADEAKSVHDDKPETTALPAAGSQKTPIAADASIVATSMTVGKPGATATSEASSQPSAVDNSTVTSSAKSEAKIMSAAESLETLAVADIP